MRAAWLVVVALGSLIGCKNACPMGGAPLNEVVEPFARFKAYPPGMKACSPGGGLSTPSFFFEGGDLAKHASTMNEFFTSKGLVVEKSGVRAATKGEFEAALKGHGSGSAYELLYKAPDANVFVSGSLSTTGDAKLTRVNVTEYDCSKKVVNGLMADLCSGAGKP